MFQQPIFLSSNEKNDITSFLSERLPDECVQMIQRNVDGIEYSEMMNFLVQFRDNFIQKSDELKDTEEYIDQEDHILDLLQRNYYQTNEFHEELIQVYDNSLSETYQVMRMRENELDDLYDELCDFIQYHSDYLLDIFNDIFQDYDQDFYNGLIDDEDGYNSFEEEIHHLEGKWICRHIDTFMEKNSEDLYQRDYEFMNIMYDVFELI